MLSMFNLPCRVQHIYNFGVFLAYECVRDGRFQGNLESSYPFMFRCSGLLPELKYLLVIFVDCFGRLHGHHMEFVFSFLDEHVDSHGMFYLLIEIFH